MEKKILILGSIASGKTFVARVLGQRLSLPIIHVDQIEFNVDLTKKEMNVIKNQIKSAVAAPSWILDGHGPLDLLPEHLNNAHMIIYLDFPLYQNILSLLKRQIRVLFRPRSELPPGANEWQAGHFKKMYQTLEKQHRLMNPELLKILNKPENKLKLIHIQKKSQLEQFLSKESIF